MGIQQSDCLFKILILKFDVHGGENSTPYGTGTIGIEECQASDLLLNLTWTLASPMYVRKNFLQLLWATLDCSAHTPAIEKFIAMLDIPQRHIWTQQMCGI